MQIVLIFLLLCLTVNSKFLRGRYKSQEFAEGLRRVRREASLYNNDEKTFFDQNTEPKYTKGHLPIVTPPIIMKTRPPAAPQKIRLRGDGQLSYNEGRVEVYDVKTKAWGLVCDDYWVMEDANVTCRELGFYNAALEANRNHRYGMGELRKSEYTLQGVHCRGNEKSLFDCAKDSTTFCISKSAGVKCIYNEGCAEGWASHNGACYRVYTQPLKYKEAERFCQVQDSKLAFILKSDENNFISDMLFNQYKPIMQVWSGGYYAEAPLDGGGIESKWSWYSTIHTVAAWNMSNIWFPGFNNWKSDSRPKGDVKTQSCIALSRIFADSRENKLYDVNYFWWDNLSCKESLPFICQKQIPQGQSDCYNGNGKDYRGRISRSIQGSVCAKWTHPLAAVNPESNPSVGLGDHNFCRNPDNDVAPWCWVNPDAGLFGYCAVGECSEIPETLSTISKPSKYGFGQGGCQNDEFNCPSMVSYKRNCIKKAQVCDQYFDCNDKEDENPEFCKSYLCKPNEFFCLSDMYCIFDNYVCDGRKNCNDGADEQNCTVLGEAKVLEKFNKHDFKFLQSTTRFLYNNIELGECIRNCLNMYRHIPCNSINYLPPNATRWFRQCIVNVASKVPERLVSINYPGAHYSFKTDCTNKFKCNIGLCIGLDKKCNGQNDCGDNSDEYGCASVTYRPLEMRLTGGANKWEGKIQIQYLGEWGFVCGYKFNITAANVVCKQLGYTSAVEAVETSVRRYGLEISPVILLDDVVCRGTELSIQKCSHNMWGRHNCRRDDLAGVVCKVDRACTIGEFRCNNDKLCINLNMVCNGVKDCSDGTDEPEGKCSLKINLVNGPDKNSGRIEVVRANIKGTVCDVGYDDNDAQVICRMLGIPGRSIAIIDGRFGAGIGRIVLSYFNCVGNEESLEKCEFYRWGQNTLCNHNDDAGVICGAPVLATEVPTKGPEIATKLKCGRRPIIQKVARVIGGFETKYGAFPWQVGVRIKESTAVDKHHCGATILSEDWIIGAQHCFVRPKNNYRVRTGDWDNTKLDEHEQEFEIKELILHPNYIGYVDNYDHDLALIKVQRVNGEGIKFNNFVQPACLTKVGDQPDAQTKCSVSGWGKMEIDNKKLPEKLRAEEVPLISREKCDKMYPYYSKYKLTDRMQCAGYDDGHIDTCQSDSGGPLVCRVKDKYTILGVTSWGNGCASENNPGVYAKIEVMLDWVKKTTGL